MNDVECTDSFWIEDSQMMPSGDEWADCRLIHESAKGWCRVYVCLHRGRQIAIKVLKDDFRDNAVYIDLLRKEYEVGLMMNHENIVSVLGFEEIPEFGYAILMEYVEGMTLGEYLQSAGKLGFTEFDFIVRQICASVSYVHSRQMVHCDIKPSNIMLTRDGRYVKLLDFGMSRGRSFVSLKFPGGTEGYTAPECLAADGDVGPQSDIYSVGCIIRAMRGKHRRRYLDRIVRQCVADEPSARPVRADAIPVMIGKARMRWRMWLGLVSLSICLLIMMGWLLSSQDSGGVYEPVPVINVEDTLPQPAVDTVLPVQSNVADLPVQSDVAHLDIRPDPDMPISVPFNEKVFRYTRECAARRFAEHIAVIDTMNTLRSNELTFVRHWRWLAKQDVRRWLEETYSADNPYVETIMADVAKTVERYGDEDEQLDVEARHRTAAIRRNPALVGLTTAYTYPVGDGRMCRETLGEDGEWTKEIYTIKPHPTLDDNTSGGTSWP